MGGMSKLLFGLTSLFLLGLVAQQYQINQLRIQLKRGASVSEPAQMVDSTVIARAYSQFCVDSGGKMENGRCALAPVLKASSGQVLRDFTRPLEQRPSFAQKQKETDLKASGIEITSGADSLTCRFTKNGATCADDGSVKCPQGQKVLHRVTLTADGKALRNHYRCRI